jgi:hypothetical protein
VVEVVAQSQQGQEALVVLMEVVMEATKAMTVQRERH